MAPNGFSPKLLGLASWDWDIIILISNITSKCLRARTKVAKTSRSVQQQTTPYCALINYGLEQISLWCYRFGIKFTENTSKRMEEENISMLFIGL